MRGAVFGLPAGAKIKSVQRVGVTGSNTPNGAVNVTISAVDMTKTIVIPFFGPTSGNTADSAIGFQLTSPTQVTVYGGLNTHARYLLVIEFEGAVSVQRGSTSISGSSNTVNVTVSSVNNARAFSMVGGASSVTNTTAYSEASACLTSRLTTATNLEISRIDSTNRGALAVYWQVLEMKG